MNSSSRRSDEQKIEFIFQSLLTDGQCPSRSGERGNTGRTPDIRLNSLWGKTNDGINFFKDNWNIWHTERKKSSDETVTPDCKTSSALKNRRDKIDTMYNRVHFTYEMRYNCRPSGLRRSVWFGFFSGENSAPQSVVWCSLLKRRGIVYAL